LTALALYLERCNTRHNIDQHLPMLREYASRCDHVTEFGVDRGWSTSALLASGASTIRSYDVNRQPEVTQLEEIAAAEGIDFQFIFADTRDADIEPTDLLFVDSEHTYAQVDAELARSIDKVKRYLIFHDTVSYPEILHAIRKHCGFEWRVVEQTDKQHGLMILERILA
jgi:methyltransferase family protein